MPTAPATPAQTLKMAPTAATKHTCLIANQVIQRMRVLIAALFFIRIRMALGLST